MCEELSDQIIIISAVSQAVFCNWTRIQNHLVLQQTLNYLTKLVQVAVTSPSDFAPASSKEFLDIQATIQCGFTLKRVSDMTRTYSQAVFCYY